MLRFIVPVRASRVLSRPSTRFQHKNVNNYSMKPLLAHRSMSQAAAAPKVNMILLKKIRDMTGAPLHSCKDAVASIDSTIASEKDQIEAAIEFLRKKGVSSAAKKASRATSQGLLGATSSLDKRSAVLVEVNCETDFVARNVTFQNFAAAVTLSSNTSASSASLTSEQLQAADLDTGSGKKEPVKEAMQQVIFATGENVTVRRGARLSVPAGTYGAVASYMHNMALGHAFEAQAQLGRTGALVQLHAEAAVSQEALLELGQRLAMHIVAINPRFLSRQSVPGEVIAKEKEFIAVDLAPKSVGKPAKVVEKMVDGKLNKFFEENCLLEQQFVVNMDGEKPQKVKDVLQVKTPQGNTVFVDLASFVRYSVGEGMDEPTAN